MTALDFAMMVAFTDPNVSRDAWYRDASGQYCELRIVLRRPDEQVSFGAGHFVAETVVADVRVSDVADPQPGDEVLIGEETFVVQGAPQRKNARLVWRMELVPA